MADLSQAHVVVTGASRGIGKALAVEAIGRGATVTGVARSDRPLKELESRYAGFRRLVADLSDRERVRTLMAEIEELNGPVDVLVNNAGYITPAQIHEADLDDLLATLEVDVVTPVILTRGVLPRMLARGRGTIVNISSVAAFMSMPAVGGYSASKAALSRFTGVLQRELRRTPVDVMLVTLGEVEGTEMLEKVMAHPVGGEIFRLAHRAHLNPLLSPEYVAAKTMNALERGKKSIVLPRRFGVLRQVSQFPDDYIARMVIPRLDT